VLKKVELVLVDHMDEVLKQALVLKEGEVLFASDEETSPSSWRPTGDRQTNPGLR